MGGKKQQQNVDDLINEEMQDKNLLSPDQDQKLKIAVKPSFAIKPSSALKKNRLDMERTPSKM
jgi:hypothetical protein